jgi:cell division protein FtsL
MKKQFSARGAALGGMRASSTPELMRRAEMGRDPRVNCSEEAFFDNYRNRSSSKAGARRNAEHARSRASASYAKTSGRYGEAQRRAEPKSRTSERRRREPKFEPITPETELRVKRGSISLSFILVLVIGAMMFMSLIFSISEIYRSTTEISKLENQLAELQNHAELLELKLEEKNDVELIEQIASEKLGMVGGESVQRRYVTLSSGEHIEIYEEPEVEETDGVVLSSIFTSLGKFFERFD